MATHVANCGACKTFDTYKPYRRRYYTDYVGTTPLLFRNVQQILRLEVWQGSDYKEAAAAEIRMAIKDHSALDSEKIFLCSGARGIFELAQGASKATWNGDFDNATTAQQIADLINKDGRRGKTATLHLHHIHWKIHTTPMGQLLPMFTTNFWHLPMQIMATAKSN